MPEIDLENDGKLVSAGTLYVVATPIGNLADLSDRARAVLSQVEVIAAEDTRHSKQLLAGFHVAGRLQPYHDFSNSSQTDKLLRCLLDGESVALISDAGTPLISDPGFKLVKVVREQGIPVFPVPGACALTAALSVAGLPTDRFVFEGFLPSKTKARQERLQQLYDEERTVVFYESPHRIADCVQSMGHVFGGQRLIFLAREMTKKFEQHFLGSLDDCASWIAADAHRKKGEFVLILAGADQQERQQRRQQQGVELVRELRADMPLKKAVALAATYTGARKNELYSAALADEVTPDSD